MSEANGGTVSVHVKNGRNGKLLVIGLSTLLSLGSGAAWWLIGAGRAAAQRDDQIADVAERARALASRVVVLEQTNLDVRTQLAAIRAQQEAESKDIREIRASVERLLERR